MRQGRRRPRCAGPRLTGRRGFGLLEAIVALALLAGTGIALFAWINQNLQAASRVQQIAAEAKLQMWAQTVVDTVNPLLQPEGTRDLGDRSVRWRAELLEPQRRNTSFGPEAPGDWRMGLYRLTVDAKDSASGAEVKFEQWRTGQQSEAAPGRAAL